ncbi:inovirus Gp2 family protein [Xenorhabdus sp. XENO-1]|uniref:YagK/YfjJ domain-containing protein n=1 Tax=Xenorhabdus bovienii TaxID=40576 RepID=UPI0020CA6C96|nr:inovirus-type Gp2 protein [Xenorhabdus bovienii]MCP9269085.1 inovirus Gp2 family protein [Xenorhabdus bovienii subsp. africana]
MSSNYYVSMASSFFSCRNKVGFYKYQDHVVPVYEWGDMSIYPVKKIMDSFMGVVCESFSRTSRVMMARFDLRVKEYNENNSVISNFIKLLRKKINQYSQAGVLHLVWVREQNKSPRQHYHAAIFTDGHVICHPTNLLKLIEECWITTTGGSLSIPKNCYYDCKRGDGNQVGKMIYRLSYMAKNITKRRFNRNARRFSIARICKKHGRPALTLSTITNHNFNK